MTEFARFCTNSAIATFALVAKLCEFHICNIFAPGKSGANSIFRPVSITNVASVGSVFKPFEGPSLETSIFPLSFQVVRKPLPFAYH